MAFSNQKSNPGKSIYCAARRSWVAAQPEEIIRQRILLHMIDTLQYPSGSIAVEQSLKSLPYLSPKQRIEAPERRVDILVFKQGTPLLMIECKAIPLSEKVIRQVAGYNHYVQARYIAIANADEVRTGWYEPAEGKYRFISYLPDFNSLVKSYDPRQ